jgi:hypothetical protein
MPSCSIQWSSKSLQVLTKSQRDEMLSMPDPVVVESRCGTHSAKAGRISQWSQWATMSWWLNEIWMSLLCTGIMETTVRFRSGDAAQATLLWQLGLFLIQPKIVRSMSSQPSRLRQTKHLKNSQRSVQWTFSKEN